ncbi:hypothetical protein AAMO2058_001310900 [Amorphochlora amoebiformis]
MSSSDDELLVPRRRHGQLTHATIPAIALAHQAATTLRKAVDKGKSRCCGITQNGSEGGCQGWYGLVVFLGMPGRRCSNKVNGVVFCSIHANQWIMWWLRLAFVLSHFFFIDYALSTAVESTKEKIQRENANTLPTWVIAFGCSLVLTVASGIMDWISSLIINKARVSTRAPLQSPSSERREMMRMFRVSEASASRLRFASSDEDRDDYVDPDEDVNEHWLAESDEDYVPGSRCDPGSAWKRSGSRSKKCKKNRKASRGPCNGSRKKKKASGASGIGERKGETHTKGKKGTTQKPKRKRNNLTKFKKPTKASKKATGLHIKTPNTPAPTAAKGDDSASSSSNVAISSLSKKKGKKRTIDRPRSSTLAKRMKLAGEYSQPNLT